MTSAISRAFAASRIASIVSATLKPVSVEVRLAALTLSVGVLLYTVFFTGIAPIHDMTHELRHTILSVPCH